MLVAVSPAVLIMRAISAAVVQHAAGEGEALLLDRLDRRVGRLGDLGGELLALLGDGGEHAAALVGQDRRSFRWCAG